MSATENEILCFGEILWDELPNGRCVGGAPLNVAAHLRALGREATVASRVGDDPSGDELLVALSSLGVRTELVQVDPQLPTGAVEVKLGPAGEPTYDILAPAAWDAIQPATDLIQRAESARVVVFGSLVQRHPTTRSTLSELLQTATGTRVFDVNLRTPYDDRAIVEASLAYADTVKVNLDELVALSRWFDLGAGVETAVSELSRRFGCGTVCVTSGAGGAALWRDGELEMSPAPRVQVVDTVGAGDAFLAALLDADLADLGPADMLRAANRRGAAVAARRGAMPPESV